MTTAPIGTRDQLAAQGYGMMTFGFESHWLPLYTHKVLTDKKPGEVAFKVRVASLKTLRQDEGYFLARKGARGFFLWKPAECLKHRFENVEYVKDKLGGTRVIRHEPTMGCRWCRAIKPEAAVVSAAAPAETVTAAAAPSAEPPAGLTCDQCGFVSKPGKPAANSLRFHKTKRHQRTAAQAAPA